MQKKRWNERWMGQKLERMWIELQRSSVNSFITHSIFVFQLWFTADMSAEINWVLCTPRTIKKSRTHVEHIDSKNRFSHYSVQKFILTCCSPTMRLRCLFLHPSSHMYYMFLFIFSRLLSRSLPLSLFVSLYYFVLRARNLNLLSSYNNKRIVTI